MLPEARPFKSHRGGHNSLTPQPLRKQGGRSDRSFSPHNVTGGTPAAVPAERSLEKRTSGVAKTADILAPKLYSSKKGSATKRRTAQTLREESPYSAKGGQQTLTGCSTLSSINKISREKRKQFKTPSFGNMAPAGEFITAPTQENTPPVAGAQ